MRVWVVVATGVIVAVLAAGHGAEGAAPHAATFGINTTEDSVDVAPGDGDCQDAGGQCSLRAAVAETNALPGADTITVPAGTYELTLPENPEGHLVVTDDLTVTGAGADTTTITQPDGVADPTRIFELPCGERVLQIEIKGVTISGGRQAYGFAVADGQGGGIDNCGNQVRLLKVALTSNTAGRGGGLFSQGGSVTMSESLIANNVGHIGAAVFGSPISLTNVTVSGNTARDPKDTVGGEASVIAGTAFYPDAVTGLVLTNVSVVDNQALANKRMYVFLGGEFKNSLFGQFQDCWGNISGGHNLSVSDSCRVNEEAGDLAVAPEQVAVGPLADNGGPTLTHALLPGSFAINGGDNSGCPATDQRGVARPQGGTCDIGAYELEIAATPTPVPTPTQAPAALPPTGGDRDGDRLSLALPAFGLTLLGGVAAGYWLRRRSHGAV